MDKVPGHAFPERGNLYRYLSLYGEAALPKNKSLLIIGEYDVALNSSVELLLTVCLQHLCVQIE